MRRGGAAALTSVRSCPDDRGKESHALGIHDRAVDHTTRRQLDGDARARIPHLDRRGRQVRPTCGRLHVQLHRGRERATIEACRAVGPRDLHGNGDRAERVALHVHAGPRHRLAGGVDDAHARGHLLFTGAGTRGAENEQQDSAPRTQHRQLPGLVGDAGPRYEAGEPSARSGRPGSSASARL